MQIKFLGTGGAFDYESGNSAAWVSFNGINILLDCGNSVYRRLRETGLANKIDYILITHCHDDHVGSLASVILHHSYFLHPPRKVNILVPSPEFEQHLRNFITFAIPEPDDYVTFVPLSAIPGISAIDTFGLHVKNMQSYGFIFESETDILVYSGDVGDPNVIFQALDARLPSTKNIRVFHEMCFDKSDGVHAYYKNLFPRLKDFTIFGYHFDTREIPSDNLIPPVAFFPDLLC
ncbi:MAG: MBL fold metallo-hydrolase [Bacteroidia bacterium]